VPQREPGADDPSQLSASEAVGEHALLSGAVRGFGEQF